MHALRDGYNDFKWTIEQTGAHLNWFNQCYRLIESVNRSIDTLRTFVNFFVVLIAREVGHPIFTI